MRTIRNILAVAFATMTVAVSMAQFGDPVYVNGYYRWDGTYVRPHYRTRPDGNFWNNWSSYGNINPYTGEMGYRLPSYDYGIQRLPAPSSGSLNYIRPLSSYQRHSLTPSFHSPSLRLSPLLSDW